VKIIPQRHTQTDRRTTYDRNTALCTKVHRAVKSLGLGVGLGKKLKSWSWSSWDWESWSWSWSWQKSLIYITDRSIQATHPV